RVPRPGAQARRAGEARRLRGEGRGHACLCARAPSGQEELARCAVRALFRRPFQPHPARGAARRAAARRVLPRHDARPGEPGDGARGAGRGGRGRRRIDPRRGEAHRAARERRGAGAAREIPRRHEQGGEGRRRLASYTGAVMTAGMYERDLGKNPANYAPLTPLSFLERAAGVYPDRVSVVHGAQRYTWKQPYERARRLGSALAKRGGGAGDTVAAMLPNIPPMYEMHFGVAMCGAVLNTLNTRLDADAIAFMLEHGEARLLVTDKEFSGTIEKALSLVERRIAVVDVEDPQFSGGKRLGETTYEALLGEGDPQFRWRWPEDEWEAISLNYTSGTTGNPKGVVYHHRGAYLNGVGNILVWGMPHHAVYLWTLPMFHCNGWCFPWTMA